MPFKKGQSGNPKGRPPKGKDAIGQLQKALDKVGKKKDTTFLEHVAERAFENDQMAVAVMKKFLPDLKQSEIDAVIAGAMHHSSSKKVPEQIQELVERVIENRSE